MLKRLYLKTISIFFRHLYHSFAWSYDLVAAVVSVGLWKQWVLSCLPYLGNATKILEIGFGPGHLQCELFKSKLRQDHPGQPQDWKIYGLDESPQMLRLCYRRFRSYTNYINGYAKIPVLIRGLAQNLPFPDTSFDAILTTFPTPFIVNPQTLAQIHRTLLPDGRLWIVLSAEFTSRRLLYQLAALIFKITGQATSTSEADSFMDRFSQAGFETSTHWHVLPTSKVMILEVRKLKT